MDDAANKITERMITDLESRLYVEYAQAEQEIRKKAREYFERYERQYKTKAKLLKDGKITDKEFRAWQMQAMAQGERWNALREQIAEDLYHVDGIARSITEGYMPEVYAVNHNYGIYQIEQNADIQTSLTLYDRATVERLMRDDPELLPPPGKKVSQAIAEKKAMRWSRQRLQSVMTQGILQGESIPRLADRLAREVGESNRKAAVRNARTMATNAQNAGRYDAYKRASDNGIPLTIEWQATLDLRTRHSHRQLHGQRREVGEPFEVDGIKILYPAQLRGAHSNIPQEMIWNCRCTLLAWVKGYEGQTVKKTKRMDGMSFEEWQEARPIYKPISEE